MGWWQATSTHCMVNVHAWSARNALTVSRMAHGSALSQAAALRERTAVLSCTAAAAAAAATLSVLLGTVACGRARRARVSAQWPARAYWAEAVCAQRCGARRDRVAGRPPPRNRRTWLCSAERQIVLLLSDCGLLKRTWCLGVGIAAGGRSKPRVRILPWGFRR